MKIIKTLLLIIFYFQISSAYSENDDFNIWLNNFKKQALKEGISETTFSKVMKDAKFLPKVIKYDRYQPEFYEDTLTYVSKRTNDKKVQNGIKLFKSNKKIIKNIDQKFSVEKELLLALWG